MSIALFSVLLSFFIFATAGAKHQLCGGGRTLQVLDFEDIQLPAQGEAELPWPYHNFIFYAAPTEWDDNHTHVMNATGKSLWDVALSSGNNLIFTRNEDFVLEQATSKGNRTFSLLSFSLTSIFYNQAVSLEVSRNGVPLSRQVLNLVFGQRVAVTIDSPFAGDKVAIACVDRTVGACMHMAYDDFVICYKP